MNNVAFFKNDRIIIGLVLFAVAGKLINAPLVSGNFATTTGSTVNYLFDIAVLLGVLIGSLRPPKKYMAVYVVILITGATYVLSTIIFTDESIFQALASHLKIYLPIMAYPIFLRCYLHDREWLKRKVKTLCWLITILLFLGLVAFPPETNRLETWWPSFFGGLHTTAYVALMLSALVFSLALDGAIKKWKAALITIVVAVSIYYGWGVRTATIASAIFVLGAFLSYVKNRNLITLCFALTFIFLALVYMPLFLDYGEINQMSSGRLAMYKEKYEQLMNNNVTAWLIGNGAGSDIIESDVWWWAEKGAHNDLISMLVEGGGIYLLGFIFTIIFLLRQGGFLYKAIVFAAFCTSVVSNGVFVRPIVGYLLVISMAMLHDKKGITRAKRHEL